MKDFNSLLNSLPFQGKEAARGFTLVELIVVITILAILGTIAFISLQGYSTDARDSVRIEDMNNINKGLALFQIKSGGYPKPDNSVIISASGTIIGYQGIVGENVSRIISTNKIITDPLDDKPYVYYTSAINKTYQLLGYLEGNTISYNKNYQYPLIDTSYAADYTKRYPKVLGNVLGILLDTSNNPISTDIDLFKTQNGIMYKSFVSNTTVKTLSGVELGGPLISLAKSLNFGLPKTCPEGFIKVQGNEEFMQPGFCVAKYEMSYTGADIPNSLGGLDWNTMAYTGAKIPVSMSGKYPIADIKQIEAIDACKSMGEGYHLITNNEWMTIAREIEINPVNWSGNAVGSGYIYNGLSNSSIGCLGTTKTIYTLSRLRGSKTGEGNTGTGVTTCDPYRKLTLQNGEIIWDFAGNLWEHVNKLNTIDGTYYDLGQTIVKGSSNGTTWDDDGILVPNDDMKKYGSNLGLGIANGMGNFQQADGIANNIFLRGAHAAGGTRTGIFSLRLSRDAIRFDNYVGFRCAK